MTTTTTKLCTACNEVKSLEDFTRARQTNSFKYSANQSHHTYCKACNAARAREWRKARPNYRGSGKLTATPKEDRLLMSAIRQRLTDARSRCKKLNRNAPTVTAEYLYELFIKQGRNCALTNEPLVIETSHPLCLSLDQIDPAKGYEEGNVQWLAWCVNRAKGDLSLEHFFEMCEVVLENRKVQRLSKSSVS